MTPFEAGRAARLAGKAVTDNPHVVGHTKLGAPKLSDEGVEWERGFSSVGRVAGAAEVAAAASVDVRRFRRKPNRSY